MSEIRRRLFRWHRLYFLAVIVGGAIFAWLFLFYPGYTHKQVGEWLRAQGHHVEFTHYEEIEKSDVLVLHLPGSPEPVSTLPEFAESTGLSTFVRRIRLVATFEDVDQNFFDEVKRLGTLKTLLLACEQTTERQIADLLESLHVTNLSIGDAQLGSGRMPWLNRSELRKLRVWRTQFSNPALKDLPDSLELLDLDATRINDDGLPELKRLRNLKHLTLNRTPTTEMAIEKLRRDMPWCEIEWEPQEIP